MRPQIETKKFVPPAPKPAPKPSKAQIAIVREAYTRLVQRTNALENALNRGMKDVGEVGGLLVYKIRNPKTNAVSYKGEGINPRTLQAVIEAGWLVPSISNGTYIVSDAGLALIGESLPKMHFMKPLQFKARDKVESMVTGRLYRVDDILLEDTPEGRRRFYVLRGAFGNLVKCDVESADFLRLHEPDERI